MTTITFGSVCSGIEAASVAWNPLGWRAAWLAEIEPFPCALLAHHYPDVPNLGDMTKITTMVRDALVPAPDVFCGGTPCQAFSVAGLRKSLDDARGNLSLIFCEIADEIDAQRAATGLLPAVIFWENVPGVLNTKDNAFGCFLAGLAGEDDPLEPAGGKWTNAGCVFGPKRTVAWRVLDAQYFGVAQRRRRVFVVASARDGFDPVAVLFESEGLRRDTAPRRQAGQDITGTISARTSGGGGLGKDFELGGGLQPIAAPVARSVERPRGDGLDTLITGTLQASGKAAGSATQQDAEAGMLIPMVRSVALRGREGGATAELGDDLAGTLRASGGGGDKAHVLAPCIAFNARQDPDSWIERTGPLDTDGGTQAVCFSSKDNGADATVELAPTMRAMNHAGSHANGGGQLAVCTVGSRQVAGALTSSYGKQPDGSDTALGPNLAICITGDITHTLKAEGFDASEVGTGRGQPIVAAFAENSRGELRLEGGDSSRTGTLSTGGGKPGQGTPMVQSGMAVRRLTPRECERLQGFEDDYTHIPVKKVKRERLLSPRAGYDYAEIDGEVWQLAADGPRYKALGNSWAVPNVAWIGRRIAAELGKGESQ